MNECRVSRKKEIQTENHQGYHKKTPYPTNYPKKLVGGKIPIHHVSWWKGKPLNGKKSRSRASEGKDCPRCARKSRGHAAASSAEKDRRRLCRKNHGKEENRTRLEETRTAPEGPEGASPPQGGQCPESVKESPPRPSF